MINFTHCPAEVPDDEWYLVDLKDFEEYTRARELAS